MARSAFSQVLFLRGMNLGGRRITNDRLIEVITSLGHPDAAAYQASGNILLTGPPADPDALSAGLTDALGYPVPCLVRSADDIAGFVSWQPFDRSSKDGRRSRGKPQLIMVTQRITPADVAALSEGSGDLLEVHAGGHDVAWSPVGGLADSDLDLASIDRRFGPSTVRTFGTIERLAGKLG